MLWPISVPGELHHSFFLPLCRPGSSARQMGVWMLLYTFRGQTRLAQQGSSSHQWLTSTSSSGHVQRHRPSPLLLPLSWHRDSHTGLLSVPVCVSLHVGVAWLIANTVVCMVHFIYIFELAYFVNKMQPRCNVNISSTAGHLPSIYCICSY